MTTDRRVASAASAAAAAAVAVTAIISTCSHCGNLQQLQQQWLQIHYEKSIVVNATTIDAWQHWQGLRYVQRSLIQNLQHEKQRGNASAIGMTSVAMKVMISILPKTTVAPSMTTPISGLVILNVQSMSTETANSEPHPN